MQVPKRSKSEVEVSLLYHNRQSENDLVNTYKLFGVLAQIVSRVIPFVYGSQRSRSQHVKGYLKAITSCEQNEDQLNECISNVARMLPMLSA